MANTRTIIYFFIVISTFIKCDIYKDCNDGNIPNDKYDCFDRIGEDDKEDEWHCCFIENHGTTIYYSCELLGKDEYNDISGFKKDYIVGESLSDAKIECHQSYIKLDKYKYLIFTLLNLIVLIIM